MNSPVKSKRHALLGKLFVSATERGITQEQLRDEIAYGVIGKRLSAANDRELGLVLTHIAGPMKSRGNSAIRNPQSAFKKYPSTIQGLRDELSDLARDRWGAEWEHSLTSLCRKFGVDHIRFIDVAHGRAIKAWLVEHKETGEKR